MKEGRDYLDAVTKAARAVDGREVEKLLQALEEAYWSGRTVFLIGNGGSAANAAHFSQDLSKGAVPDLEGRRLKVLCLADSVAFMTALANDIGYERVFELQLRPFASPGDILVAISGSGNSPNILKAAAYAKEHGLTLVGFTGFGGGKLLPLLDIRIHVPLDQMCMCEAVHSIFMHMVADLLRARLNAGGAVRPDAR